MATLLTSPRKQSVPLATGDEKSSLRRRKDQPQLTKRVFFCSVVVENPEDSYEFPSELQDFVAQFGDPLDLDNQSSAANASSSSSADIAQAGNDPYTRTRHPSTHSEAPVGSFALSASSTKPGSAAALQDVINELVATERSYVKRLRILRDDYAKPLREYSRNKETLIIPPYEAKTLFGNVDQLLPVNEAFLEDLETMVAVGGYEVVGGVGDVALRHFKELKGFESYRQYYAKREEAQAIFEREIRKGSSGLATFIDRIKYATADARNRVGLRELLMEPVQRIPRYTLLFREMVKHMDSSDPQRAKLIRADELASRIAQAAPDEETRRAAVMYAFTQTVEDFPVSLMSNARRFIDCIDVDDVLVTPSHERSASEPGTPSGSSISNAGVLHCSLLLFDDKLVILKRPNADKGVRALTNLDEMERLTKAPAFQQKLKSTGIQYKGMVDLTEVVATDVGGPDFHIYLEVPPVTDSERWSGRPFRALSVVHPPSPVNLDPKRTEADKQRFMENLWVAQARYRTRAGQSVVVQADEQVVEEVKGRAQIARTYFNIYQRTAFLRDTKKTKIVVQIDPTGVADPIPFGASGPPFVIVRVQPMAGELSRYTVTCNSPYATAEDIGVNDEEIVQSARVPERIVQSIHYFGLYHFRTGNLSLPGTPTASIRTKAAIFGLDAISRNLFHARPGSSKGDRDFFGGGSLQSRHAPSMRRSKTAGSSRASIHTIQSISSGDSSSISRFTRSRSNSTTATSLNDSSLSSRNSRSSRRPGSMNKARKLIRRKVPPNAVSDDWSEGEMNLVRRERSASTMSAPDPAFGRSLSAEPDTDYSDYYEDEQIPPSHINVDRSERDLMARLELAKRNSRNQHEAQYDPSGQEPAIEDAEFDIEEYEWSRQTRPDSRGSHASRDRELPAIPQERERQASTGTVRPSSTTPTKQVDKGEGPSHSSHLRPSSWHPTEHRPQGPRIPSRSPRRQTVSLPWVDDDFAMEGTLPKTVQPLATPLHQTYFRHSALPLPRSKRQPFDQSTEVEETPGPPSAQDDTASLRSVEPLVIRRKPSTQLHARRKQHPVGQRTPSMTKASGRVAALRRTSSSFKHSAQAKSTAAVSVPSDVEEETKRLFELSQDTTEQALSARAKVQRLRDEYERLLQTSIRDNSVRATSPIDNDRVTLPAPRLMTKTPPRPPLVSAKTKEAQERMQEMYKLLKHRPKLSDTISESTLPQRSNSPASSESKALEELAIQIEAEMKKVVANQEATQAGLSGLAELLAKKTTELEDVRAELNQARVQKAMLKTLLNDVTQEKDILFDAFNDELDTLYQSMQFPDEEGWRAMAGELLRAAEKAKAFEKQKALAEYQLAEANVEREELLSLLREHGLYP